MDHGSYPSFCPSVFSCEQCVECPSCYHILTPTARPSGSYAYVCEFCHWCSEDYTGHIAAAATPATSSAPQPTGGVSKSPLTAVESNLLSARIKDAEASAPVHATFQQLLTHYRSRTMSMKTGGVSVASSVNASTTTAASAAATAAAAARKQQLFDGFEHFLAASDGTNPLLASSSTNTARLASLSVNESDSVPDPNSQPSFGEMSNVARWMSWRSQREELLHRQHYTLPKEPVTNRFAKIPQELLGYFEDGVHKGIEESQNNTLSASDTMPLYSIRSLVLIARASLLLPCRVISFFFSPPLCQCRAFLSVSLIPAILLCGRTIFSRVAPLFRRRSHIGVARVISSSSSRVPARVSRTWRYTWRHSRIYRRSRSDNSDSYESDGQPVSCQSQNENTICVCNFQRGMHESSLKCSSNG